MKMKRVGSGVHPKFYYVDPPLVSSVLLIFHKLLFQYNTLRSAVEESLHPIVVFCIVFTALFTKPPASRLPAVP